MEVLAVSAALPQWHDVRGKKTFTSIVRPPLESGEITLDEKGVQDNQTAVHDGPVYALFAHHYDYWCEKLHTEREDWGWCHWGENITLRCDDVDLNEQDIRLGDIWEVGGRVRLQVCGARVPCFKLSWRCGQPDSWLKPLADSGFCGVYLRVMVPGTIKVGDRARIVEKQSDTFTCASITSAAFDSDLKTRDTFNLLANEQRLVSMLRRFFGRKAMIIDDQLRVGKNAWEGWRQFRPHKIVDEGGGIVSFSLKPLDDRPLATFIPGQFLTVRLPTGDIRSWSLSDWPKDPDAPQWYRLSIKKANTASLWMATKCSIETIFDVRSPRGAFCLDWTPMLILRQIYISAGVGITPIFSMLKAHAKHGAMSHCDAIWIHVARNADEVPFRDELDLLPPQLQRIWCFTAPRDHEERGRDYEIRGRPDVELLRRTIVPGYNYVLPHAKLPVEGPMSNVYICGPQTFETDMKAGLSRIGVPAPLVKSETFSGPVAADVPDLEEAIVKFSKSNVEAKWHKSEPLSLLELAEKAGLQPEYGCRSGVCGSCSSKVVCGSVAGGLQPDGNVYICVARPEAALIEVEI